MRLIRSLVLLLLGIAMGAGASAQTAAPAPRWDALQVVFDRPSPRPGVRLIEVHRQADGTLSGTLTSDWYGVMAMSNVVAAEGELRFDVRNINVPGVPTRRWRATPTAAGLLLEGGIWESEVKQVGRAATPAEVAALTRTEVPLPPLGRVTPDGLAATPPMGWSSWNAFAERIDDRTVRAMADAMVTTGLRDAGYVYINIDDGWQGMRGPDGALRPNAKFPDMAALAAYVHGKGLKLGLYSSPGLKTCAGYTGSYGHVEQDARTFADWGIDYLKYDLCSGEWQYADAGRVQRAYYRMGAALKATGRPIVFSLCEYGRFDVAGWGRSVGGHLWRTTGDITDDYARMSDIGFERNPQFGHAGPGGWNDPDMLEVGNGGMSQDEYRTHMTLWAMSAAPLIMGHDLRTTTPTALALLRNRAVVAIDQDRLGRQGAAIRRAPTAEVWAKPLADGSFAIALFNRGPTGARMTIRPKDIGATRFAAIRDLWSDRTVAVSTRAFAVPAHGARLLRVRGR